METPGESLDKFPLAPATKIRVCFLLVTYHFFLVKSGIIMTLNGKNMVLSIGLSHKSNSVNHQSSTKRGCLAATHLLGI